MHGHTTVEVIVERADAEKPYMGLTTWADAPEGKIGPSDVMIAKNYLSEFEMEQLNRMVSAYLDIAETMAQRHIPMTMQDWETRLNGFIQMLEYGLFRTQRESLLRLPSSMRWWSLRNTASSRIICICRTMTDSFWNWKGKEDDVE